MVSRLNPADSICLFLLSGFRFSIPQDKFQVTLDLRVVSQFIALFIRGLHDLSNRP